MCPQIVCLRRCIITLIAFVWLFSAVHFQMSPQIASLRGRIVTLLAFVWLFFTVRFKMNPQIAWLRGCIGTLIALFDFSPLCILRWLLKLLFTDDAHSHWLHLFDFSPSLFVFLTGISPLNPLTQQSSSSRFWYITIKPKWGILLSCHRNRF